MIACTCGGSCAMVLALVLGCGVLAPGGDCGLQAACEDERQAQDSRNGGYRMQSVRTLLVCRGPLAASRPESTLFQSVLHLVNLSVIVITALGKENSPTSSLNPTEQDGELRTHPASAFTQPQQNAPAPQPGRYSVAMSFIARTAGNGKQHSPSAPSRHACR